MSTASLFLNLQNFINTQCSMMQKKFINYRCRVQITYLQMILFYYIHIRGNQPTPWHLPSLEHVNSTCSFNWHHHVEYFFLESLSCIQFIFSSKAPSYLYSGKKFRSKYLSFKVLNYVITYINIIILLTNVVHLYVLI